MTCLVYADLEHPCFSYNNFLFGLFKNELLENGSITYIEKNAKIIKVYSSLSHKLKTSMYIPVKPGLIFFFN